MYGVVFEIALGL